MAAKKDDFVTKKMLDEAVDAILKGMNNLLSTTRREMKSQIQSLKSEMNSRFNGLETEIRYVKDEVKGIKAELSDTLLPTTPQYKSLYQFER